MKTWSSTWDRRDFGGCKLQRRYVFPGQVQATAESGIGGNGNCSIDNAMLESTCPSKAFCSNLAARNIRAPAPKKSRGWDWERDRGNTRLKNSHRNIGISSSRRHDRGQRKLARVARARRHQEKTGSYVIMQAYPAEQNQEGGLMQA